MKLNGRTIPTPRQNIAIEYIEISRSERTVSGLMVKDIIAIKKQYTLSYTGLKPEEAQIFIDAYISGGPVEFEYVDVQGEQSVTVYVMSLPREIYSYRPNYTANITVALEER